MSETADDSGSTPGPEHIDETIDDSGPTTTHDPSHGGAPRLALERESYLEGEAQAVWYLEGDVVTIGSDPGCGVVLPGLEPVHATVLHDDRDEFLVRCDGPEVRVHGQQVRSAQLLRSGARLEVGDHVLAYYRDEHADHGRPFGGRQGGEIGRQRSQPARPEDADLDAGDDGSQAGTDNPALRGRP